MKKNYFKSLYGRLCAALLLLITAFVIHSCRKEAKQESIAPSTPALTVNVDKFKAIYNTSIGTSLITKRRSLEKLY